MITLSIDCRCSRERGGCRAQLTAGRSPSGDAPATAPSAIAAGIAGDAVAIEGSRAARRRHRVQLVDRVSIALDDAPPWTCGQSYPRICIHSGSPARLCDPRSFSSACATARSGPSCVTIATSTLPSAVGAALHQAFDRDAGVAHRRGDLGQHADLVRDHEAQIGAAAAVAAVGGGQRGQAGGGHRVRRAELAARDVDQVGDHRAGGRAVARARALEQQPADEIALRHHRVERAGDVRERMVERARGAGGRAGTGRSARPRRRPTSRTR